jgi:hypothetical protein
MALKLLDSSRSHQECNVCAAIKQPAAEKPAKRSGAQYQNSQYCLLRTDFAR